MRTAVATSSLAASSHASGVLTLDAFDQKSEYTQQTGCKSAGKPMEGSNENRSKSSNRSARAQRESCSSAWRRWACRWRRTWCAPASPSTGFDLDARSVHALVQAGGRRGSDAHAAARECDVRVTMLPDDRIVHDVLAGYGADDTPGSM